MSKTRAKQTANKAAYNVVIPNTPIRFLWYVTKPEKRWMIFAVLLVIIAALLDQSSYFALKLIIDAVETGNKEFALMIGLSYPFLIFLIQLLYRSSGYMGMKWSTTMKKKAYLTLVPYVNDHSHTYFSNRFAGSVLKKVGHIIDSMEELIQDGLWTHLNTAVSLLVTMFFLATVDFLATALFISLIFTLLGINKFLAKEKRIRSFQAAEATTKLNGYIVDVFTNIAAARQYSRKLFEFKLLEHNAEQDRVYHHRTWFYTEKMLFLNSIVLFVFVSLIFWVALNRWSLGEIGTGDFILVVSLIFSLSGTLVLIGRAFNTTAKAIGYAQEGLDDLLLPHDVVNSPNAKKLKVKEADVTWKEVTFEFGRNKVFDTFNLTVPAGQRVGLVGPSGAGKTTFVSLLLRQHDIDSGVIEIDGQDISKVTQDSLREQIAVVPQEPLLFHRSIRENIAYGKPDATDEEIIAVAKKAQAHDFIKSLPETYHTLVGERGVKLSGGQKQRVAIARAMLKDAPILVLDEATSALDSESEVAIQQALHKLMTGKTVVAIAHRLSTLREMDRIIVLEGGKIVEDGSHDALVNYGGVYARLWKHQAGGFLQE